MFIAQRPQQNGRTKTIFGYSAKKIQKKAEKRDMRPEDYLYSVVPTGKDGLKRMTWMGHKDRVRLYYELLAGGQK